MKIQKLIANFVGVKVKGSYVNEVYIDIPNTYIAVNQINSWKYVWSAFMYRKRHPFGGHHIDIHPHNRFWAVNFRRFRRIVLNQAV